jgi:hypothetical protein
MADRRAIQMSTTGIVANAIADYLGIEPKAIKSLEYLQDPMVAGTYAFQAVMEASPTHGREMTYQFLTIGVTMSKITSEDLEECDWETWPPKSTGRITSWMVS